MKKITLFICILGLALSTTFAQSGDQNKRGRLGIKAGVNLAKETYEESGISLTLDNKIGLLGGLVYEYGVTDQLYLGTGLLFSQKGGKFEESSIKMTETLNYIDVPVNLIFKADLKGPKLLVEVGPQLSVGLSGKDKYEGMGEEEEEDVEFGSDEDQVKMLDFGLNLGGGFEYMNLQLKVNYVIGLNDISNYSEGSVKNKVLGISLSYFFN